MTVVLNNTILSNFSIVARPDLVRFAFQTEEIATVRMVMAEHETGIAKRYFPKCDWSWLPVLDLKPAEQNDFGKFSAQLGKGESECLAIAKARGLRFATDDRDARRAAQRLEIPITGTLGILAILVKKKKLNLAEADKLLAQMVKAGFQSPIESLEGLVGN